MAASDFLLNLLSAALETAGESKLIEILQQLHDKNIDQYNTAIFGGHALVKALLPITAGTKTKIDDAIIKALDEAINQSAAANGVIFPE